MARKTYANISTKNLLNNLEVVKKTAPNSKIMAIVKANAYGHNVSIVANALKNKVDAFGVSQINEAIELRNLGIKNKILLLEGVFEYEEMTKMQELELDIVIHSKYQFEYLKKYYNKNYNKNRTQNTNTANIYKPIVWIKFDSAMGRLGFDIDDKNNKTMIEQILTYAKEVKLMTHFASANISNCPQTKKQIQKFEIFCKPYVDKYKLEISCANSAGIVNYPLSHYNWVRAGIMLYGVNPVDDDIKTNLKPVMEFVGSIISIKNMGKNHQVGYGDTCKMSKNTLIATVSVGYGDGYLVNRSKNITNNVFVNGIKCDIVGAISMDMIAIDISNMKNKAKIGDKVQFWGNDINIKQVAIKNSKNAYELMCLVTPRVLRIVINDR